MNNRLQITKRAFRLVVTVIFASGLLAMVVLDDAYAACTTTNGVATCCESSVSICQSSASNVYQDAEVGTCAAQGTNFCHSYDVEAQAFYVSEQGTLNTGATNSAFINGGDDPDPGGSGDPGSTGTDPATSGPYCGYTEGDNENCFKGPASEVLNTCQDTLDVAITGNNSVLQNCTTKRSCSDGEIVRCYTVIPQEEQDDLNNNATTQAERDAQAAYLRALEEQREAARRAQAAFNARNNADRAALQQAGSLVPCTDNCGWRDFILMGNNIINWVITFASIVAVGMFAVAGFMIITAGGKPEKFAKGRDLLVKVIVGFAIILLAWLMVRTVLNTFLGSTRTGPSIDEFIERQ